ncbi:hypothetical protein E1100_25785 [Vibrio owensii]|uniref:hypothetical protein n=1 Tax=Vibrio owensii TaxID=696485 RepID=UPI00104916F9|nr:hypothetical protein [Vibrio owensii]TDE19274.1 hypothetical protein E1100_25785 [Vibrio owensii]
MLSKTHGVYLLLLGVMFGVFTLRVEYLEGVVESKDADLVRKEAELTTAKLSIETVTGINTQLNTTVGSLTQHIEDERQAVQAMNSYFATVDANVSKAVSDIQGLLNDEQDDCDIKPLPAPVIERMWDYYRPEGSHPN